jgi:nitronate monooxygenase
MSGIAPAPLAAAVCNTGALGSIGCAALSLTMVREQVTTLRQATNRPFNLNFFVPAHPRIDPQATARVRAELASYFVDIVKRIERGELKQDPRHITELRLN